MPAARARLSMARVIGTSLNEMTGSSAAAAGAATPPDDALVEPVEPASAVTLLAVKPAGALVSTATAGLAPLAAVGLASALLVWHNAGCCRTNPASKVTTN